MQKKLNKTLKCLCVILTLILNLNLFVACKPKVIKENPYHMYFLNAVLKESFIFAEENRIDLGYFNVNYDPRDSESKRFTYGKSLPNDRVILLQTEDDLKRAFKTIPDIDMEQKMVFIVFTQVYGNYTIGLSNTVVEDNVLKVTISIDYGHMVTEPMLYYFVREMDKMDIRDTEVNKKIKR